MNKKFYTYEEILLALRDEYLKNQELLSKLTRYIYIENDSWVESYRFRPRFEHKNNYYKMIYPTPEKTLYLELLERISFIKQTYAQMLGNPLDRQITYNIKKQDNNSFTLNELVRGNLVWFDPKINITNQQIFNELIMEIFNSDFMSLQHEEFYSMFGYRLNITAEQLWLGNHEQWIRYNASNDVISINRIKDSHNVLQLIHELIPECYINDHVKELVTKNLITDQQINIEECSIGKKSTFKIIDTNTGIKLKKLKK